MACGPKEYRAHAELCLRRACTVRNPILAEEFEKLAQSWLRLAEAQERAKVKPTCWRPSRLFPPKQITS